MKRREDWPQRLFAEIARHDALPFGYGVSDCWKLGDGCVFEMTGERLYESLRYRSGAGALRELQARGFSDLAQAVAARLPEIPVAMAGRGDLGIAEQDGEPALVVCEGATFAGKGRTGIYHAPRARVSRAFKVG